jgi:hypothetical protein
LAGKKRQREKEKSAGKKTCSSNKGEREKKKVREVLMVDGMDEKV